MPCGLALLLTPQRPPPPPPPLPSSPSSFSPSSPLSSPLLSLQPIHSGHPLPPPYRGQSAHGPPLPNPNAGHPESHCFQRRDSGPHCWGLADGRTHCFLCVGGGSTDTPVSGQWGAWSPSRTLLWADPGLPGGDLWPRAARWGSQASQTQARGAHPQVAGEARPTPGRRPQPKPQPRKPGGGKQVGAEDPGHHQPRWLQGGRKSGCCNCKRVPCPPQMDCAGRRGHRPSGGRQHRAPHCRSSCWGGRLSGDTPTIPQPRLHPSPALRWAPRPSRAHLPAPPTPS